MFLLSDPWGWKTADSIERISEGERIPWVCESDGRDGEESGGIKYKNSILVS